MPDRATRTRIRWGDVLSFLFASLASPAPTLSFYRSALTSNSLSFCRSGNCSANRLFSYQPIGFMTATSGTYDIRSNGTLDTVGYIFNYTVRQITSVNGAVMSDDQSGGSDQFSMTVSARAMFNYTLIVTTYDPIVIGPFSVIAAGDSPLTFFALWVWLLEKQIDESLSYLCTFCWFAVYLLSLLSVRLYPVSCYHMRFFFISTIILICCVIHAQSLIPIISRCCHHLAF